MYIIQIRFNTEHQGGKLKWRVVVNGVEHLASRVACIGVAWETTEDTLPGNIVKHHVTVSTARVPVWQGDEVLIE